jgi:hypothetical protein
MNPECKGELGISQLVDIPVARELPKSRTLWAVRFCAGLAVLGCDDGWNRHTDFGGVCQLRSIPPLSGSPAAERPLIGSANLSIYCKRCTPSRRLYFGGHESRQRIRCRLHPNRKRARSYQARLHAPVPIRRSSVCCNRLCWFFVTEICRKDSGRFLFSELRHTGLNLPVS